MPPRYDCAHGTAPQITSGDSKPVRTGTKGIVPDTCDAGNPARPLLSDLSAYATVIALHFRLSRHSSRFPAFCRKPPVASRRPNAFHPPTFPRPYPSITLYGQHVSPCAPMSTGCWSAVDQMRGQRSLIAHFYRAICTASMPHGVRFSACSQCDAPRVATFGTPAKATTPLHPLHGVPAAIPERQRNTVVARKSKGLEGKPSSP